MSKAQADMSHSSSREGQSNGTTDAAETRATRRRYDRIARFYDVMGGFGEQRYRNWRERAWALVAGPEVLEVGVGTGKNIPYYPPDAHVTAIDVSAQMLSRARRRAEELAAHVTLREMDAQNLEFPDDFFDSGLGTFIFCSVPDAVLGLQELRRVVKPGGRVVLLEHVRALNPMLGTVMDVLDPLVARLMGPHINRETVANVRRAGLEVERVESLDRFGIFTLILARA